jgi:predicted FMN-binding regulatory protein PaiB
MTAKSTKIHQKGAKQEVKMEQNRPKSDKKRVTKKGKKTKGQQIG